MVFTNGVFEFSLFSWYVLILLFFYSIQKTNNCSFITIIIVLEFERIYFCNILQFRSWDIFWIKKKEHVIFILCIVWMLCPQFCSNSFSRSHLPNDGFCKLYYVNFVVSFITITDINGSHILYITIFISLLYLRKQNWISLVTSQIILFWYD